MPEDCEVSMFVWGDLACFSRPEAKVERVTYEAPPASVCRGILESVLWKPEFRWWVRRVRILRPIRFVSLRRNEVQGKLTKNDAVAWMEGRQPFSPLFADSEDRGTGRTQRQTIALRNVAYEITASIHLPGGYSEKNPPRKYREIFERRLSNGQAHNPPCFGCREFAAYFGPELPDEIAEQPPEPRDLGWMLLDVVHRPGKRVPRFFEASIGERGVLEFPHDAVEQYWREALS